MPQILKVSLKPFPALSSRRELRDSRDYWIKPRSGRINNQRDFSEPIHWLSSEQRKQAFIEK